MAICPRMIRSGKRMTFLRSFYRTATLCSFASAVTTLFLIYLPRSYGPAASLNERVLFLESPFYQLQAWSYLVHPFFTLAAALGIAAALRRRAARSAGQPCFGSGARRIQALPVRSNTRFDSDFIPPKALAFA